MVAIVLLVLTCCLVTGLVPAVHGSQAKSDEAPSEYEIKAAFLYNYVKFTKWPEKELPKKKSPYVIGILGQNPFDRHFDKMVEKKTIRDRKIEIRYFKELKGIRSCHVLFVSASEQKKLPAILKHLAGSDVLTVSDIKDFAARGGMVHLFIKGNKTKFAVNFKVIEKQRFKISSQLLNLAENRKKNGKE